DALVGKWAAFDGESLGVKLTGRDVNMRYEFTRDNKVTYTIAGQTGAGTYSVNTSTSPKTINISAKTQVGAFNLLGIYKIEDDVLTICFGNNQRPTMFATKGVPLGTMYMMKRGEGGGPGIDPGQFKDKFKDLFKDKGLPGFDKG